MQITHFRLNRFNVADKTDVKLSNTFSCNRKFHLRVWSSLVSSIIQWPFQLLECFTLRGRYVLPICPLLQSLKWTMIPNTDCKSFICRENWLHSRTERKLRENIQWSSKAIKLHWILSALWICCLFFSILFFLISQLPPVALRRYFDGKLYLFSASFDVSRIRWERRE